MPYEPNEGGVGTWPEGCAGVVSSGVPSALAGSESGTVLGTRLAVRVEIASAVLLGGCGMAWLVGPSMGVVWVEGDVAGAAAPKPAKLTGSCARIVPSPAAAAGAAAKRAVAE